MKFSINTILSIAFIFILFGVQDTFAWIIPGTIEKWQNSISITNCQKNTKTFKTGYSCDTSLSCVEQFYWEDESCGAKFSTIQKVIDPSYSCPSGWSISWKNCIKTDTVCKKDTWTWWSKNEWNCWLTGKLKMYWNNQSVTWLTWYSLWKISNTSHFNCRRWEHSWSTIYYQICKHTKESKAASISCPNTYSVLKGMCVKDIQVQTWNKSCHYWCKSYQNTPSYTTSTYADYLGDSISKTYNIPSWKVKLGNDKNKFCTQVAVAVPLRMPSQQLNTQCSGTNWTYYKTEWRDGYCQYYKAEQKIINYFDQYWIVTENNTTKRQSNGARCTVEGRYATPDNNWPTIELLKKWAFSFSSENWCNIKKYLSPSYGVSIPKTSGCEYYKSQAGLDGNAPDLLENIVVKVQDTSWISSINLDLWKCRATYDFPSEVTDIVANRTNPSWVKNTLKAPIVLTVNDNLVLNGKTYPSLKSAMWVNRIDECLTQWKNYLRVVAKDNARSEVDWKSLSSNQSHLSTKNTDFILIDHSWVNIKIHWDQPTWDNNWLNKTAIWKFEINDDALDVPYCENYTDGPTQKCSWTLPADAKWNFPNNVNPLTGEFKTKMCNNETVATNTTCKWTCNSWYSQSWNTCVKNTKYRWATGRWSACNSTINYRKTRAVVCQIKESWSDIWTNAHSTKCAHLNTPASVESCNIYTWETWDFSQCTNNTQTRTVKCYKNSGDWKTAVSDWFCNYTKPKTQESCSEYKWKVWEYWACENNIKTRSLACYKHTSQSNSYKVDNSFCGIPYLTELPCNSTPTCDATESIPVNYACSMYSEWSYNLFTNTSTKSWFCTTRKCCIYTWSNGHSPMPVNPKMTCPSGYLLDWEKCMKNCSMIDPNICKNGSCLPDDFMKDIFDPGYIDPIQWWGW